MSGRIRFKRGDNLVHDVGYLPTRGKWGSTLCSALFQWEPGTERRADRTHDVTTCLACASRS